MLPPKAAVTETPMARHWGTRSRCYNKAGLLGMEDFEMVIPLEEAVAAYCSLIRLVRASVGHSAGLTGV